MSRIEGTGSCAVYSARELAAIDRVGQIMSLRGGVRGAAVSPAIQRTILEVQDCLAKGTDLNGWKKVDWRSSSGRGGGNFASAPNRGGGNFRPYRSNTTAPVNNSAAASVAPTHTYSGPPPKYTSKFKSAEKVDDAVLMLIQDKLNKFSPRNYPETHGFLCQILDSGKTHFLKDFMKIVFQKATREAGVCPHYARLLCELTSKYEVLLTEMVNRYKEFSAIFEDISDAELAPDDYKALLEENTDKAYRLGYAQFLGELVKYNVLSSELFIATLQSIICNIPVIADKVNGKHLVEEYTTCLMRILQAIQGEKTVSATTLKTALKERFLTVLEPLTVKGAPYKGLSPKGRCIIMDILDIMGRF
jgi:MIF4G domain